jgi:hypothetical protein
VNADVIDRRSSHAHTVVTLVRLDGAYMEGGMIARVKVGAPVAEHHRDAADAGKRPVLIDGRRVERAAPLRCGGTRSRPTPRRSPHTPGKAMARSLIGVLARLNLPSRERSPTGGRPRRSEILNGYSARAEWSYRWLQHMSVARPSTGTLHEQSGVTDGYSKDTSKVVIRGMHCVKARKGSEFH